MSGTIKKVVTLVQCRSHNYQKCVINSQNSIICSILWQISDIFLTIVGPTLNKSTTRRLVSPTRQCLYHLGRDPWRRLATWTGWGRTSWSTSSKTATSPLPGLKATTSSFASQSQSSGLMEFLVVFTCGEAANLIKLDKQFKVISLSMGPIFC